MDQTQQQWLDYFHSGRRYDVPYNLDAVRQYDHDLYVSDQASNVAMIDTDIGMAVIGGLASAGTAGHATWVNQMFFGDNPNPTFGISSDGLHLPTVPLIRWEDIVAVILNNFRGTWHRAANASIVPEPQVGSAGSKGPMDCQILVRNGELIRSTIDPRFAAVMTPRPTPRGQSWGSIDVRLDPGLGQEQIVELVYLLGTIAAARNVPIEHTGGFFGDMRADGVEDRIIELN